MFIEYLEFNILSSGVMVRIGIDARFYRKSTAGIGRYTRGLLNELGKLDKKNEYFIFLTSEDFKEFEKPGDNFKAVKVDILHYSLEEQTKLPRILASFNLDLMHYTNFNHPIFSSIPFVVTIHDLIMTLYPVGRKQKSLIRKWAYNYEMKHAASKAKKVIVPSEASKNDVMNILGAQESSVVVTYEGVDEGYKKPLNDKIRQEIKEQYGINKPYLLFMSQWRPHKGIVNLIEAYKLLRGEYHDDIDLVLGGKMKEDFPEILEAINCTKRDFGGVITPGFIPEEDLPAIYDGALAYVLPSLYEGFCLTHLEAMAAGVPVATSNTSCMPEILQDAAIYFDPKDPHDIARILDRLINDEEKRKELVKLGKIQVKKYSWKRMAEQTLEIYEEAVNLQN